MDKGDTFVFYPTFLTLIEGVRNDMAKLQLYQGIVNYGVFGVVPDYSNVDPIGGMDSIFAQCRNLIDESKENRKKVSEIRSACGSRGAETTNMMKRQKAAKSGKSRQLPTFAENSRQNAANDGKPRQTTANHGVNVNGNVYVNDNGNDNGNDNINSSSNLNIEEGAKLQKRFVIPTIDEVENFIKENNYSVKAQSFYDYYTSNGWKVGKNPMRDWRATIRNWNARNLTETNKGAVSSKTNPTKNLGYGLIE